MRYFTFIVLVALGIIFGNSLVSAQQLLDSANVIFIDNTSDNNTGANGTLMNDPKYKEFLQSNPVAQSTDGWWTNNSSVYWGGNHRRASRYGSGNNTGAHAQWYCSVQNAGYYLVYHHMNSGNSTTRAFVRFYKQGYSAASDSFYYNMLLNNTADIPNSYGSWYPLGIVELAPVDSALTVDIGLDSTGSNTLRCDAIALLRSPKSGPSIEFGSRRFTRLFINTATQDTFMRHNFLNDRPPLGFSETTFKWDSYSEQLFPIYNLGTSDLVITGFETMTNRYSVTTPTPITIPAGTRKYITIRFSPKGEEVTYDTLTIINNDPDQSRAKQPLVGTGINYNFILNASVTGAEPHWNVPPPGGKFFTIGTSWLTSSPSPWSYPVSGGNNGSVVNTGSDPTVACFYQFRIPDTVSATYFLEYSGPAGSSNAAQSVTVDVKSPFYTNPNPALGDTQRVIGFNSRLVQSNLLWVRIGGSQVFKLNGGDTTTVRYVNPIQGTDYLRADLLRVRLVPIAPTISTSLDPSRVMSFGSVSIYDSIRNQQLNYSRTFVIASNGETPLRLDTIYLKGNTLFTIANLPTFPITLPAIDGQYSLRINFLPDSIRSFADTLIIRSNATADTTVRVRMAGQGVGTGITVDETDPSTWIYPATPIQWTGTPDPSNMDKWYSVLGSGGVNQNRLFHYIYFNTPSGPETIEWFPYFPFKPGSQVNEIDSFYVSVQLSAGSGISSPAAKYLVFHQAADQPDTFIVNQNSTTYGGAVGSSGIVRLGNRPFQFLRGGQDSHGAGKIFGYVQLVNDTALVSAYYRDSLFNRALRDSFVVRADAVIFEQAGMVGITAEPNMVPSEYSLSQNYPNPFNPSTKIRFAIPRDGKVELKVYDILGREVTTIINADLKAGNYTYEWNGRNNFGNKVSTGMYIYRIVSGKFVQTKKMILMK